MFRFGRILLALVLVGLLIGAGALLYRAGMDQGYQIGAYSAAPAAGTPVPGANALPSAPYYAPYFYGPRFGPWGFGYFNPFGWILGIGFFILIFFVVGSVLRLIFFRGYARRGFWGRGPWGYGPGGHGEPGEVPPFFKEWHERAHQQSETPPETPSQPNQ